MNKILVAEDSPTQAIQVKHLLVSEGFQVETVANGVQAIAALERGLPDLVLTDLEMPEMNGLQLVEAVHRRFPRVPVVLMTAFGSDEVAARALEAGAASYVPKRNLETDLVQTIRDLFAVVEADRQSARLVEFLTGQESHFDLGADLGAVQPIVGHVQAEMAELKLIDETERIRVGIALETALRLAIAGRPAEQRAANGGNVWLHARLSRSDAQFTVGMEGHGFNDEQLRDDVSAELAGGDASGWVLVKSFMDDVRVAAEGAELLMTKRGLKVLQ
jgi:CheY-like chemotaxis protein